MPSDADLRAQYGATVPITRSRGFALVHLDRPGASTIEERTRRFDPDEHFEPECPLCAIQRIRRVVLFDDPFENAADDEVIVLDDR